MVKLNNVFGLFVLIVRHAFGEVGEGRQQEGRSVQYLLPRVSSV